MIKIDSDELYFALSFMKDIVPDDNHMDIWRYVKLSTNDGKLTIRGMTQDKQGIIQVPYIESEEEYEFAILLKQAHDIVSQYKKVDETILLEPKITDDGEINTVVIRNSFSNVSIQTVSVESFPTITFPTEGIGTVVPNEFVKMLPLAKYVDSQFSVFQKLHMFTEDDMFFVEATDTYCGGKGETELSTRLDLNVAVAPDIAYILGKMSKLALDDEVWNVFLPEDFNMFFVSGEYWSVGVGILNGTYPDTQNIYKNSNISRIELSKELVNNAIASIAPVIENNRIKIKIKSGTITFECRKGKSELDDKYDVADNEIVISLYNIRKIIGSIKSKTLTIQIGSKLEPFIVLDTDNIYYTLPYRGM